MCNFFSAVVLKDGKILWDINLDSHDEILRKFEIYESPRSSIDPQFAKIEITPQDGNVFNHEMKNWVFRVDESIKPQWLHEKQVEKEVRSVLKKVFKIAFLSTGETEITNSRIWLSGDACATLWDNSRATLWDNSQATLVDNSQATLMDNSQATLVDNSQATLMDNSQATLRDNSRATLGENSQATLWDNSQATLWDNSRATLWDNSRATLRDNSQATLRDNGRATLWDNSQATPHDLASYIKNGSIWVADKKLVKQHKDKK